MLKTDFKDFLFNKLFRMSSEFVSYFECATLIRKFLHRIDVNTGYIKVYQLLNSDNTNRKALFNDYSHINLYDMITFRVEFKSGNCYFLVGKHAIMWTFLYYAYKYQSEMSLHEILFWKQKPTRFFIDFDDNEGEYKENIEYVLQTLCNAIHAVFTANNIGYKDILIFGRSNMKTIKFHLTIPSVKMMGVDMKETVSQIASSTSYKLDLQPYNHNSTSSLRSVYSYKSNECGLDHTSQKIPLYRITRENHYKHNQKFIINREKKIINSPYSISEYIISEIHDSDTYLYSNIVSTEAREIESCKRKEYISSTILELSEPILKLFDTHPILSCYRPDAQCKNKRNLYKLKAIERVNCPICNRVHDKDQNFLILSSNIIKINNQTKSEEIENFLKMYPKEQHNIIIKVLGFKRTKKVEENENDNISIALGCFRSKGQSFKL